MKELKKQHLEMLQLLESIEVMLQNGDSICPNSVIRGAIQTAIGMEVDVTNVNDKFNTITKTAVECIVEQLTAIGQLEIPKGSNAVTLIIEQAKALEKEQIIEAHNSGYSEGIYQSCESGEEYYNETFKNK